MSSVNHDPAPEQTRGLPPVAPPSGRFIAQLFLIPGMIVTVLVLIWLAGTYLVAEKRSPDYFLDNLNSSNPDIRWRAAHDLAQVLPRPESLDMASDPIFVLNLAERLHQELGNLRREEAAILERTENASDEEKQRQWQKLNQQRDYVLFLTASLSSFTIPVGAPLLCELATSPDSGYGKGDVLLRRRAVWALANLGENRKRFQKLPAVQQEGVIAQLGQEREKEGLRGEWAAAAYEYLKHGKSLQVDATLQQCAKSEDTYLRSLVGLALNFWDGPRVEPTLLQLAQDNGWGRRIEISNKE